MHEQVNAWQHIHQGKAIGKTVNGLYNVNLADVKTEPGSSIHKLTAT
jgi:hypothetical protein